MITNKDLTTDFVSDLDFKKDDSIFNVPRTGERRSAKMRRNDAGIPSKKSNSEIVKTFPKYMEFIKSKDESKILIGVTYIRQILAIDTDPPISEVIEGNFVPFLCSLLKSSQNSKILFEISWALSSILSGTDTHINVVLKENPVPRLIFLLDHEATVVVEQSVWCLANICGQSDSYRNTIIKNGVLQPLLEILKTRKGKTLINTSLWFLSNMFRGKRSCENFKKKEIFSVLEVLKIFLYKTGDPIVCECCWVFSYISDNASDDVLDKIISMDVIRKMVELLTYSNEAIATPCLRTIGNFASGSNNHTCCVCNYGIVPILKNLIKRMKKKAIVKEVLWTLSNITASSSKELGDVLLEGWFPIFVKYFKSSDRELQYEAGYAIVNSLSVATVKQLSEIENGGCMSIFPDYLANLKKEKKGDQRIITLSVEALNILFSRGKSGIIEKVVLDIAEEGILSKENQKVIDKIAMSIKQKKKFDGTSWI